MMHASEDEFQRAVIELAQLCGFLVAHFRTSMNKRGDYRTAVAADGKGFPDLVLVHPERGVMFRELKSETGKMRDEQVVWIDMLVDAGADAAVWRPRDWDHIELVLRGPA